MEQNEKHADKTKKRFNGRGFISLLLTFSFLVVSFTGVALYAAPKGRVAHWINWRIFGLTKEQWETNHINFSLLFIVMAVLHFWLNRKAFVRYIKERVEKGLGLKQEFVIAAIATIICFQGTFMELPPFDQLAGWSDQIKIYWERRSASAPYAHAEDSSLKNFARRLGLPPQKAAEALKAEGFDVSGLAVTVGTLAESKGVAPCDVYEAIRKHHPEAGVKLGPQSLKGCQR